MLVPQLALLRQGELQLFDDPEVLDYPWELSTMDAKPTSSELADLGVALKVSEGGVIDVDEASGKMMQSFMPDLQRDLGLAYLPEHWDAVKLASWLCTNIPEPTLTHASKLAFVSGWLSDLLVQPGFDLGRANLQKFLMRNLLEASIRDLRRAAVTRAYQLTIFGEGNAERVTVSAQLPYDFRPEAYSPSRDYDDRYGLHAFRKHFYSRVGDFDSKEEFECAVWLDTEAQKGRLQYWVRNLARREGASFFLQKATDRFYPDFLARIHKDGAEWNLILEVTGQKDAKKETKVATARNLWVPSVNNHGTFGRWAFLEITDPWNAKKDIAEFLRSLS